MNSKQLHYLNAMGIQPWQLKQQEVPRREPIFIGEPLNARTEPLFHAMLEAIGLDCHSVSFLDISTSNLEANIKRLEPISIIALGNAATHFLLKTQAKLEDSRGKVHSYHNTPVITTYHPDHLIGHPSDKKHVYQDLRYIQLKPI